jgi:PAS domain S-box-containing protein
VHRRGTSTRFAIAAAITYLVPLLLSGHWNAVSASSIVYVVPSGVMLGEAIAWVSDRLRDAQLAIADREESFRKLFSENPQPMWLYDRADLSFIEVNVAAIAHYGYSRDEFLAMRVTDIRPERDVDDFVDAIAGSPHNRRFTRWQHLLKDGRVIDVDVTAHRLEFAGHDATLVAVQDVTERLRLEDELRHRAFHDDLTELANRSLFVDRVQHALDRDARSEPCVAVVVLDVDGFKNINDSLGHTAGDGLLVEVGERLRANLRPGDTAARLGGDEFAVLFEDASGEDEMVRRAERLLAATP